MTKLLARLWIVASSFGHEFLKKFAPGKNWIYKIGGWVVIIAVIIFGAIKTDVKLKLSFDDVSEVRVFSMNAILLISDILVAVWILICIGNASLASSPTCRSFLRPKTKKNARVRGTEDAPN